MAGKGAWTELKLPGLAEFAHFEYLKLRVQELEQENAELRGKLEQAHTVEHLVRRLTDELQPVLDLVAAFAMDNERMARIDRVLFTLGETRFYFLFILEGEAYEWDLADSLGDLQRSILELHSKVPVSCSLVPGGFGNEEYRSRLTLSILPVQDSIVSDDSE